MNLLALDTSTECCSVALWCADQMRERSEVAPRRQAERVLPMVDELLAEAQIVRAGLDGIAVGCGPGAFTGVRLGVSVAQGMALALDLPVVAVSSLAALALDAPDDDAAVLAVIDARMGELYAGAFSRSADGLLQAVSDECVCKPADLVLPQAPAWHVVGTGWGVYAEILRARLPGAPRSVKAEAYPQARHVARLALPRFASGDTVSPENALPVYLRNKVAQTLRERGKPVPHL